MQSNGLATILLMIPVLTVPALAIFGIPQFAPVVASPLDEGKDNDRETGIGNSARHSHDELFDDVEGFGSEPEIKSGSASQLRDRSRLNRDPLKGTRRHGDTQRTEAQTVPGWGDDLTQVPERPRGSRRPSSVDADELPDRDHSFGGRIPKSSSKQERSPRYERRSAETGRAPDVNHPGSADDSDPSILQAGWIDDASETEKPRSSNRGIPPRANEPRSIKRREPATEPLTWAAAVERLNELEIRGFRLEPGHGAGQFVFICSYTPPESPSVSYRFEAGADEPLKAVAKVLEQIVEWRQKR